ncbi:hypothetical protein GCM10022419_080850 [Nonomuraea rosea]|uniref:HTH tetR-type domain-containing protein n=1 Tax=Nonomuraea rosea TaxID=638574 RepID=A0ABP6YPY0_9ACTN
MTTQHDESTLRDRKRRRTRQMLIEAAAELFEHKGYDETTVAEIAAAAEIGTRTFFSYFASKEEILFPESEARTRAAIDAITSRQPDDRPIDVLLHAVRHIVQADTDMVSPMARIRLHLMRTVPAIQGRVLRLQQQAQRDIARHLHAAFPDHLDEIDAGALVGALIGAISGALLVLLEDPELAEQLAERPNEIGARIHNAAERALSPWATTP